MSFGKEAKLGVAVLFALSLVLAAVVVWRMVRPGTVDQPMTEATPPVPGPSAPGASAAGAGVSGTAVAAGASTRPGDEKAPRASWGAAGVARASGDGAGRELSPQGEKLALAASQTAAGQSGSQTNRGAAGHVADAYDPFHGRSVVGASEAAGGATASSDIPPLPAPPAAPPAASGRPLPTEAWAKNEPDRGAARIESSGAPRFPGAAGQGSVASRAGEVDPRTMPAPPPPSAPAYAGAAVPAGRDSSAGAYDPRMNSNGAQAGASGRYAAETSAARTPSRGYADDQRGYANAAASSGYGGTRPSIDSGGYSRTTRSAADDQLGTFHRPAAGLRGDGTYEIQPNDSFWAISEKCYGTGNYFKALAEHNRRRIAHQDDLKVGDLIEVPSVSDLESRYPDLCPKPGRKPGTHDGAQYVSAPRTSGGRIYLTQHGDTLYEIARRELGKASRWTEIYELNRAQIGNDYNFVPPGLKLVLPDQRQPTDSMTRRPQPGDVAPSYQR